MPRPSCARTFATRKTSAGSSRDGTKRNESIRPETWLYEGATQKSGEPGQRPSAAGHQKDRGGEAQDLENPVHRDPTLQHPRCVFQVLKRHFARYTPELVERDRAAFRKTGSSRSPNIFCSASGPEKTGAICYAVGWTQHSTGVQIIRAAAILQLLLGNIGRPGGGILALRGHASIQGSTDIPTLYDILPGYLPMPLFEARVDASRTTSTLHQSRKGWWNNLDKYIVSLLKAYYGDARRRRTTSASAGCRG